MNFVILKALMAWDFSLPRPQTAQSDVEGADACLAMEMKKEEEEGKVRFGHSKFNAYFLPWKVPRKTRSDPRPRLRVPGIEFFLFMVKVLILCIRGEQ